MKKTIILIIAVLALIGCTKKSNPSPFPTTPNPYLERNFPYIDTATLWNVNNSGNRTGAKATISSAGVLTITGYHTPGGTFASGTYLMQLQDTLGYTDDIRFNLYQYGPDTIVSIYNELRLVAPTSTTTGRLYYDLTIYAPSMPPFSIVAGEFIDSL